MYATLSNIQCNRLPCPKLPVSFALIFSVVFKLDLWNRIDKLWEVISMELYESEDAVHLALQQRRSRLIVGIINKAGELIDLFWLKDMYYWPILSSVSGPAAD